MKKASDTPTVEAPATEAKPLPSEKRISVPAGLFFQMIDALRATDLDSRRNDRVLHEPTRDMVADSCNAVNRWQDKRIRGGARV